MITGGYYYMNGQTQDTRSEKEYIKSSKLKAKSLESEDKIDDL